jgi:exodeoxyribonuclease-3
MPIGTRNVNSLGARSEQVLTWRVERKIDVALLQQTKCTDGDFPFDEFAEIGYQSAHHGVNHWNGVAIVSRVGLEDVAYGFQSSTGFAEPRLIDATNTAALVAGDFNVGMADIDFYDAKQWAGKKHATDEERAGVQGSIDLGFVDLARDQYRDEPQFTWWNYVGTQFAKNKGLRLDLALGSKAVTERLDDVWVDRHARNPLVVRPAKPSDHAPLIVDLL